MTRSTTATTATIATMATSLSRRRRQERIGAAFAALYDREHRGLLRLAYSLTGSRGEAEELVQEAFVRCHQHWHRIEKYDRPGAWLRRVVLNLATSRRRQMATELRALARLRARPEAVAAVPDVDEEFWTMVRRLPRRQAHAVVLFYGDDLSATEVAEVMDCAEGTVRALLHQARTTLARRLAEEGNER